jgi:hypothetical protein
MSKAKIIRLALAMLAASVVLQLIAAIAGGVREKWMQMTLCSTGAILAAIFWTTSVLALKMDRSIEQVKKSLESDYPRPEAVALRPIHGFATAISTAF